MIWLFRREVGETIRAYPYFFGAAALYLLANFSSAIWAGNAGAMLEAGARGYLIVLGALTLAYLRQFGRERLLGWWKWGTVAVAGIGLLYLGLIYSGVPDRLNWVATFPDYPYFGGVHRLRGTAVTYGMWVMLLLPGFIFAFDDYRNQRGALWPVGLLLLAMLPTLSKEVILAVTGAVLLTDLPAVLRYTVATALTAVLVLGTHYLLLSERSTQQADNYTNGQALLQYGDWTIVESVYTPIKRVAIRVGLQHFWLGVGPGQLYRHSTEAMHPGELPENFGRFDPHSAWTGAFAETGLFGLLGLLMLVAVFWYYRPAALTPVAVLLLLFLIASIFKDVMNFRGLWVLMGVYLSQADKLNFQSGLIPLAVRSHLKSIICK